MVHTLTEQPWIAQSLLALSFLALFWAVHPPCDEPDFSDAESGAQTEPPLSRSSSVNSLMTESSYVLADQDSERRLSAPSSKASESPRRLSLASSAAAGQADEN